MSEFRIDNSWFGQGTNKHQWWEPKLYSQMRVIVDSFETNHPNIDNLENIKDMLLNRAKRQTKIQDNVFFEFVKICVNDSDNYRWHSDDYCFSEYDNTIIPLQRMLDSVVQYGGINLDLLNSPPKYYEELDYLSGTLFNQDYIKEAFNFNKPIFEPWWLSPKERKIIETIREEANVLPSISDLKLFG